MKYPYKFLIGDNVIVKSTGDKAVVTQQRYEDINNGSRISKTESYYIKYKDKPHGYGKWIEVEHLELDKVDDELKHPEQVYYVIIDTFLKKEHLNFDMVKYYDDERNNLK